VAKELFCQRGALEGSALFRSASPQVDLERGRGASRGGLRKKVRRLGSNQGRGTTLGGAKIVLREKKTRTRVGVSMTKGMEPDTIQRGVWGGDRKGFRVRERETSRNDPPAKPTRKSAKGHRNPIAERDY